MQTAMQPRGRSSSGRPSIENLYREFEAAHAVFFKLNQGHDTFVDAEHRRLERAVKTCNGIANELTRTPATSTAEILLKLRIIAWQNADGAYTSLEQLDGWKHTHSVEETEAAQILAGLHADLRRLARS